MIKNDGGNSHSNPTHECKIRCPSRGHDIIDSVVEHSDGTYNT